MNEKISSELVKVTIGTTENEMLERMCKKLNENYQGGKICRIDLVCWLIEWFEKEHFENCIETIREEYFDQMVYFEALLRQMKIAKKNGQDVSPVMGQMISELGTQKKIGKKGKSAKIGTK